LLYFAAPTANAADCGGTDDLTFTVKRPALPGYGENHEITIPNNRPIYALF
ncbi:unnamed protein product, partial [marine sediment metagenome]